MCFLTPCLLTQSLAKEELENARSKADELNKAKDALEKNGTKLTSELKALSEKSEKVGDLSYQTKHTTH